MCVCVCVCVCVSLCLGVGGEAYNSTIFSMLTVFARFGYKKSSKQRLQSHISEQHSAVSLLNDSAFLN